MNSTSANTLLPFDHINDPSLSLILHQQEPQYEGIPISFENNIANDFLDFGDFGVDIHTFPPSEVSPQGGRLPRELITFPQGTSLNTHPLPQPSASSPLTLPPTSDAFGGASALISNPSASQYASSSSAAIDTGEQQMSLFGLQKPDLPMPAPLGPAPAPASSYVSWMNPVTAVPAFGWPSGAPTPVMHTGDGTAPFMEHAINTTTAAGASAYAEPRQVPLPHCSCRRRYPLVRVDDTIEWIRPDVTKIVLYFNWSLNAEDEAHDSWESRDAGNRRN